MELVDVEASAIDDMYIDDELGVWAYTKMSEHYPVRLG